MEKLYTPVTRMTIGDISRMQRNFYRDSQIEEKTIDEPTKLKSGIKKLGTSKTNERGKVTVYSYNGQIYVGEEELDAEGIPLGIRQAPTGIYSEFKNKK